MVRSLFRLPKLEREWGERYFIAGVPENQFCHIIPKYKWVQLLKETGFEIELFNSQYNLEHGVRSSFFAQFQMGNLFMVAKRSVPDNC